MAQIIFKRGEFRQFRTLSSVHMGLYQRDIPKDTIIEFDGAVVRWGDETFNLPQFIGAVNARWAVPVEDNVSYYIPQPAGVQVRPATSAGQERGEPMTVGLAPTEEERLVGTVDESNARRKSINEPAITSTANTPKATAESVARAKAAADARRQAAMASEAAVLQEEGRVPTGVADGEFFTPSYPKVHPSAIVDATQVQPTQMQRPATPIPQQVVANPVRRTVVGSMEVISDVQEAVPVAKINSRTAAAVGAEGQAIGGQRTRLSDASQAANAVRVAEAARPARTEKLVSSTIITSGTPIDATLDGGATGDVAEAMAGDELGDILPDLASSGVPQPGIAGTGQVTWDRAGRSPKDRAEAAVAQYGNNPGALKQVMAQETPQVQRLIRSLRK